ncbi:Tyrosinase [Fusarium subglutinans]|uniref:Tyrosinase n=1 Tax=Gibberella subglutinans TaxID=42677 RepID=A0A8H5UU87_GIBSU|nr:Tyrosinase [Fusarium subglutinans]KAF5597589.1 Tyrosinase [Fusarium subglutinans]
MRFLSLAFPALCAAAAVSNCENPTKRVEWRDLDDAARQQYTDAVLCLSTKPSRLGNAGYNGVMPYWDWFLDADDTPKSTIWDPKTGFGGNGSLNKTESIYDGRAVRKCLDDGPFKDFFPAYLPTEYDPHCLARDWNDGSENVGNMLSEKYNKEAVAKVQAVKDYDIYRQRLEAGPHGAIHSAMGGDMVPNTSPNDPIFFFHHTQIDRLWYLWQQEDPKTRTMEFAGYKTQDQFDETKPPPASLDDILLMNGLADDLKVKDLIGTQSSLLCYPY